MNKILIVDDDPMILRALEHILVKEGYEVLTATNGLDGLRIAQEKTPDLVILDVMLPGLDGFEVCYRLRHSLKTGKIPILMLSAKGQPIDQETGHKVGAFKYVVKPVNRVELLETIQKLFASRLESHPMLTGSNGS
jgi:DNA-binding response OmpR family regulator